jgi:hypothetical protein
MADFQTLVGKAISDESFAQKLVDNPEQALQEAGITPTPEMLDALKGIDVASVKKLAESFGEGRAAF